MELSTGQIMPSYAKPSNQGVRERFFHRYDQESQDAIILDHLDSS